MEDVYGYIEIPGVGLKKVLVTSSLDGVSDIGDLEDIYVITTDGKKAIAVLQSSTSGSDFATLRVGDIEAGDFSEFEADGTLINKGKATTYDEVSHPMFASRLDTTSGRIDYNYDELTVDFATNARYPDEPANITVQAMHSWKTGGEVRPHIHWMQNSDNNPNILVAYRAFNNGEVAPGFTLKALSQSDNVFDFSAGIQQITEFNLDPAVFSSMGLSFTLDVKIYRDSQNTSGLFPGADSYSGEWEVKYYDVHFEKDSNGSHEEFVK